MIHEFGGHGVRDYDGSPAGEGLAYTFQRRHSSWKKTTPTYQSFIKKNYESLTGKKW